MRPASVLAWLVHDALPAVALRSADGHADTALHAEGQAKAEEAVRSRVRTAG